MNIKQDFSKSLAVKKIKIWPWGAIISSIKETGEKETVLILVRIRELKLLPIAGSHAELYSCWGRAWRFLPQLSVCLLWDPLNHNSGLLPREMKIYVHTNLYGNANNSFVAVVRSCKELELSFRRWKASLCVVHLHPGKGKLILWSFRDTTLFNRNQSPGVKSDAIPLVECCVSCLSFPQTITEPLPI